MRRKVHEIKLDEDDVEWLQSTYPGMPLSHVMTTLLKEFRGVHKQTPADLAKLSASEVRRMIADS